MNPKAQASICLIETHREDRPSFLVIERASDPSDHWSGHLSFPGGKIEDGESALQAALRECREEIGLDLSEADLINDQLPIGFAGQPGVFGLWVKPFIFSYAEISNLTLDSNEVSQILWLDKFHFLDPLNHDFGYLPGAPTGQKFPYYPLAHKFLWGYSYRVLCDYLHI